MISTRVICGPFVGRAAELEHLALRRRSAGDAHGGLVLVGGEPGIGKSRLVRQFLERLNRRTSLVASSACREFAQKPLGPLVEVLAQIGSGSATSAHATKAEMLDATAGAFENAAAKRTTVVILEDLHWADVDLVQTLLMLVRRAATKRLLFVGTFRDNELSPAHPLFKWFGQLFREPAVSVVTLPRFEAPDLDRLMLLAIEERATLSIPVLHAVRDRSDGNPLFAEELLRNAVDAQRAGRADAVRALPLSLHALVADRLQVLSNDERSALRQASLFGRDFRIEHLHEIFGSEPTQLQPILDRLCELQLIDAVDAATGDYRFRHALTRESVYAEIPADVASDLHETIAEHLERSPNAAGAPEVLGHHFWEAGLPAKAAGYYERAGDAAIAVFAYDDAAAFYQRAAAGFAGDRAASARACASAARAMIFAGELGGGLDLYERAVTLALELGDIADVVKNRVLMAGHMFDGGKRAAATDLLRATLPLAQRGDAALQARLRTRLAMTLARDGRTDEAWSALLPIDAAQLDPHAAATGEYYLCASELHALRGDLATWQDDFATGVAIYEALGHPGPTQIAHANFAVQALSMGEMELAREHCQTAAELAQTLHFEDQAIMRAQVELYAGNLAEARRIVAAMAPSRRFLIRAMLAQVALPLAVALGDTELLDEHFDESLILDAGPKAFTATLARVAAGQALALAAKNRRREARALLGRAVESLDTAFGMALVVFAVAALMSERASELRPLLQAAAEPEGDRVNKALLALLDATTALEGAQRFAAIGWPLFEARCLEIGGKRQAALAIYRRCGAAADVRRLEFGPPGGEESSPLGVLTTRERELALQVALGKPNRAVALSLSIGEKAVEKYLTSIYAKLGLTSRAQLAALVAASQSRSD
ncbi:MAG TPA: AAA family ATPase [Candidatus Cybelea sp.]|nr:AAA family ATPase [Candidatus Cybelea sp.]